jgi:uncharacterized coiled-coil DUF342 family protein
MTEDQFNRFVEYVEGRFQELPTRAEWSQFTTKADLAQFATKGDLSQFATKADLKEELGALRAELRAEMRERFDIVHERLVALESGQEDLRSGIMKVRDQINDLGVRMEKLESHARETNRKLIDLRDDMQQRLRVMNERLTALEQRLAA